MPPKISLEPGQSYHIYNRGNNRDLLYREEENYHYFLRLARKHIIPIADVYAYALLPDHFHFLIRIKDEEELARMNIKTSQKISSKFGHWFNAYAKAYNKRYNRVSSLFEKISSEACYPTRVIFCASSFISIGIRKSINTSRIIEIGLILPTKPCFLMQLLSWPGRNSWSGSVVKMGLSRHTMPIYRI